VEEFESKHDLSLCTKLLSLQLHMGTTGSARIVPFILSQVSSMSISEVAIALQIESQAEFDDINWRNIESILTRPMFNHLRKATLYFTDSTLDSTLSVPESFQMVRLQMPILDKRGLVRLAERPFW
jgi:hypothetical protein